jgi:hypothetical protein
MGVQKRRSRLAAACVVDKAHLPKCIHLGRTNRGAVGFIIGYRHRIYNGAPVNIREEFRVAAARSASSSESIGGCNRLDSRLLVFKSRRCVLVVLTVPICVCRARARRVETYVRARVRISGEFHEGNADVRIHGGGFSPMCVRPSSAAPDIPSAGPLSQITLEYTRHHAPPVTRRNRVKIHVPPNA